MNSKDSLDKAFGELDVQIKVYEDLISELQTLNQKTQANLDKINKGKENEQSDRTPNH